jgi:hypothetical protein
VTLVKEQQLDLKNASEAVGLLGKLKEVKDNFTGKAEIKELQAQFAEKEQQLEASPPKIWPSLGLRRWQSWPSSQ